MTDEHSAPPALAISGEFTIFTAAELKPRLLHAVIDAESEEVDIDLSEVSEIDSAGLQLLLLLKREAQRGGKRVALIRHSQAVRATIEFCNLAAELGDPLVIPAAEAG